METDGSKNSLATQPSLPVNSEFIKRLLSQKIRLTMIKGKLMKAWTLDMPNTGIHTQTQYTQTHTYKTHIHILKSL